MAANTFTYRQGKGETHVVHAIFPTQRIDGADFPQSELKGFIRSVSFNGGTPDELPLKYTLDESTPEFDGTFDEILDIDKMQPGTYVYSYKTVDIEDNKSDSSEPVTMVVLAPLARPNPPTGLSLI